jgi:hypothetical protein
VQTLAGKQMARRITINLLLAFLVVQCPFQCFFTSCAGSSGSSVDTCSCCDREKVDDLDGPAAPSSPSQSDEKPCGDCFCEGALAFSSTDSVFPLADEASLVGRFLAVAATRDSSGQTGQLVANSLFLPLIASGHRVRAALSSWQI